MAGRHNTALGYCDETDLENFLLIDINNNFSPQIEDWIATAEAQVNNYLGYTTASGILAEQVVNEIAYGRVDSDLNLMIFPRKIPIISLSSLTLTKGTTSLALTLADNLGNVKYNIPSSNDFILYPSYELALAGSPVIKSFADIKYKKFFNKISYTAGYTSVPADIRMATVNLVSDMVMRHTNKEGLDLLTQGRVTKRWATRLNPLTDKSLYYRDAMELLRPYRIATKWI